MLRFLFIVCFCHSLMASEKNLVEVFTKKIPVEFIKTFDPGYIRLKLPDGKYCTGMYKGIDHNALWKWEDAKPRKMILHYSMKKGVVVLDLITRREFQLTADIENHPIDYAAEKLAAKLVTTIDFIAFYYSLNHCWDAELNRVYNELGGKGNAKLKTMQKAWLKFRDAQIELIKDRYSQETGSMYRWIPGQKIMHITRDQVKRLQALQAPF